MKTNEIKVYVENNINSKSAIQIKNCDFDWKEFQPQNSVQVNLKGIIQINTENNERKFKLSNKLFFEKYFNTLGKIIGKLLFEIM